MNMPFLNRFQLRRPCVGEFRDLRDCQRFYDQVGALAIPDRSEPRLTMAQAGAPRGPRKQDVDLMEILKDGLKTLNVPFVCKYQRGGSCVGQATALCADIVMAVNMLLSDVPIPGRASVAVAYTGGRVEVAGRPGSWAGSNGSWATKFVTQWGVGLLKDIGLPEDSLVEDERLAFRWTASRSGVPEEFEKLARTRPILSAPLIQTVDEVCVALESGSPVIDCSNLIPTGQVDRNGISRVRRSGGHATTFSGVRWFDSTPQIRYTNSWSDSWGDDGSVWITAGDAQAILDQEDSYALVGVGGLNPLRY